MKIKTHFPLDLPHIPLMPKHHVDKIVKKVLKEQVGKVVEIEIDGESFEATIIKIIKVDGGFDTTIEYED
jgi:hypothetical protein